MFITGNSDAISFTTIKSAEDGMLSAPLKDGLGRLNSYLAEFTR